MAYSKRRVVGANETWPFSTQFEQSRSLHKAFQMAGDVPIDNLSSSTLTY